MLTISKLLSNFRNLDTDEVIQESAAETSEDLNYLNQKQLYAGKTRSGEDITPSYFDDPFFKSRESAAKYSKWKDRITPNPLRTPGTPNLYINGYYYDSRSVLVSGDSFIFDSSATMGSKISQKFKDIDGLGGDFKKQYLDENLGPVVRAKLSSLVGLRFS